MLCKSRKRYFRSHPASNPARAPPYRIPPDVHSLDRTNYLEFEVRCPQNGGAVVKELFLC